MGRHNIQSFCTTAALVSFPDPTNLSTDHFQYCARGRCLVIFDKHRAPVSPPTTEWLITTLIHTECLVIFDRFSCLDGMSNYDISRATKRTP